MKNAPVAQRNRAVAYEASGSEFESQRVFHCTKCNSYKLNKDFYSRKRKDFCKQCHREYRKEHYNKNKEYYIKKARRSEAKIREKLHRLIVKYLDKHPCVDCNEPDWRVLSFDHIKGKKVECISVMVLRQRPWAIIKEEIKKCAVRCMNCHRRRTAKQFNYYGYYK